MGKSLYFKHAGLNSFQVKFMLSKRYRGKNKATLEFAKMYLSKPRSFWKNVLWTEVTKDELFGKACHSTGSGGCSDASHAEYLDFVQGNIKSGDYQM